MTDNKNINNNSNSSSSNNSSNSSSSSSNDNGKKAKVKKYPDGHNSLHDWRACDRPREKYMRKGPSALSNVELIAILLNTGTARQTVVELAQNLLLACNGQLSKLSEYTLSKLMEIKGIGEAKAITLRAAFELGNRVRSEKVEDGNHISSATDVLELMQDKIAHLHHEEFWAVYLNNKGKALHTAIAGKGGLTSTAVDVRLILKEALLQNATSIVLCHNHPSGLLRPSKEDLCLTRKIKNAADLLNIKLVDHIIVYQNRFFSFSDEGYL